SAPLVRGWSEDTPAQPRGRVRNTRLLMVLAALIMTGFLLGSVLVTTLLVPSSHLQRFDPRSNEVAQRSQSLQPPEPPFASERALAYLAHGAPFVGADGRLHTDDERLNSIFGPEFGTLYDLVTILVLCLAGISVSIGLRDLLPRYLARY